jgi:hypothetical protein
MAWNFNGRCFNMQNKWLYLKVVQGHYGVGWEDLTQSENYMEAREDLDAYNHNEKEYPHRLITRKELQREVK